MCYDDPDGGASALSGPGLFSGIRARFVAPVSAAPPGENQRCLRNFTAFSTTNLPLDATLLQLLKIFLSLRK